MILLIYMMRKPLKKAFTECKSAGPSGFQLIIILYLFKKILKTFIIFLFTAKWERKHAIFSSFKRILREYSFRFSYQKVCVAYLVLEKFLQK